MRFTRRLYRKARHEKVQTMLHLDQVLYRLEQDDNYGLPYVWAMKEFERVWIEATRIVARGKREKGLWTWVQPGKVRWDD